MKTVDRIKLWVRSVRADVKAIAAAARDPRTPSLARWVALGTLAYAVSPIDLIPDFIPVIGQLDDVLLVALGLWLALRLIPSHVLAEHRRPLAISAESHDTSA